jgi:ATP-binding cassette subfamily B protein
VRTSTVLQYELVECGAASLKIVLAYFGKVLSLGMLRDLCGISRDGVTALQLKQAALSLGLTVRARRCSASQLRKTGRFPCILFWNFSHFLVLEGFADDHAYLSDPASGRRREAWADFEQNFTGAVLEMEPGDDFVPGGEEPGLYRWLPQLLAPYREILPWLLLVSLTGALPELFIAAATSRFIDGFLEDGRENIAMAVIWITTFATLVLIALLNLQKLLLRLLANSLLKRISSMLYFALFSLPYRYFLQRLRGELAYRLSLGFSLTQLGVSGVIDFILALGSGMVALLVGVMISPLLSIFTLAVAGGNALLTLWARERRQGENARLALAQAKSGGVGIYILQSIESLKASGLENEAFRQWSALFIDSLGLAQRQSLAIALLGVISTASGFLLRCGVILLGGVLIIVGRLSLGELMAFQFLMGLIQAPLQQLALVANQLQQLDGDMGRFNDVADAQTDPLVRSFALPDAASEGRRLSGALELQQIGFQFSSLTPMLFAGLDLSLGSGQHLAIVGGSGSGKSTLLRLIAGLQSTTQGRILYDGRPWLDWDDASLRRSLALVAQDVFLLPATLEQNLTLWDPRFSAAQVVAALEQVGLLEELGGASALAMPVGEGGANLSGGQRQRVEIARALLRDPALLLMDEATSALDDRRESQILAAAKQTSRTLITVAHRLKAAMVSDLVLVLDRGAVVQQGHPDVLAAQEGPFQVLLAAEHLASDAALLR